MKFDINRQSQILNALNDLAGPYKLGGAVRRAIVKNRAALLASIQQWDQARVALAKEIWPNKPDNQEVSSTDDPEGFARFKTGMDEINAAHDDLDLLPLSGEKLYGDDVVPLAVIQVLNDAGLIEE